MTKPSAVLLDTGVLGRVTHPKPAQNRPVAKWLRGILADGSRVYVPEICDYELRRSLIRISSRDSLAKLDQLATAIGYLALTTSTMRLAARLWAEARSEGYPTAPDESLDGDVILAAQARSLSSDDFAVVVATGNPSHLTRFVDAREWQDIP